MPVVPNVLERQLFARQVAPGVVLDLLGAGGSRGLHAAITLGVFDALREPASAQDLATRCGLEPRACMQLLRALRAFGYVRARSGRFELTPLTRKYLQPGKQDLRMLVRFWHEVVFPFWDEHLEHALRHGAPPQSIYAWMDTHGGWPVAQDWFRAAARVCLDEVVRKAALPGNARKLLDVGGGHGLFSVAFARAHPSLQAEVLDLPLPLREAERTLAGERAERVALRAGDYARGDLGTGYDAVLLFNVLHAHTPADAEKVVAKAAQALAPGGRLLVLDQFPGLSTGPAVDAFIALLGLNYLTVLGGQVHTAQDVEAWMGRAGLGSPEKRMLRSAPGASLVSATAG
jgi:SAM-dependent methyltransferase